MVRHVVAPVMCHTVLRHAVLRHAVLHHAVLCHAVLCHAVLRLAVLRHAVLRHAMPRLAVLCHVVLHCSAASCGTAICCATPCHALSCCAMLCHASPWCALSVALADGSFAIFVRCAVLRCAACAIALLPRGFFLALCHNLARLCGFAAPASPSPPSALHCGVLHCFCASLRVATLLCAFFFASFASMLCVAFRLVLPVVGPFGA